MPSLTLGQRVTFKAHVKSQHEQVREVNQYGYAYIAIKNVVKRTVLATPKSGIVTGVRVLREGTVRGGMADDDPTYLDQTKTVKVYLVAVNLSGFYRVLPEDIHENPDLLGGEQRG
jgi:hypothetical protein